MPSTSQAALSLRLGALAPQAGAPGVAGRRVYRARYVCAGPVRAAAGQPAGIEILPEALNQAHAAGLFESRPVFVDHTQRGEPPSLDDLVGVTRAATFDGQAVEGLIELYSTPHARATAQLLDELLDQQAAAPDIGLSLVFYPVWTASQAGELRLVSGIRHIESLDLVFEPAAGGRVLQALSAARQSSLTSPNQAQGEPMPTDFTPLQTVEAATPALGSSPASAEAAAPAALAPSPGAALETGHPMQPAAQAESWLQAARQSGVAAMLQASSLPPASRARLAVQPWSAPEELREAIEGERRYLAQLQSDSVVQVGGQPPRSPAISGGRDGLERLALAIDALLAGTRPPYGVQPLSGIREAYLLLSGDYEMSGLFQPERLMFANVTSSTMAGLVANALNKRLAFEFEQYPRWWEPFSTLEDFASLQDVRWITLGGVGELPTVAEGAAYSELAWDDKTETAAFVKKGGYLGITLEAIDKDDVGRLRAAPRALAQAAWLTLSKAISEVFTLSSGVGPSMSDGLALFHSSHANLGSTALSVSSYAAARLAMRKQTELNSGERLGALAAPRYLLVPPDLEITALQVLASEHDYSYAVSNAPAAPANPLAQGGSFEARMNAARERVIVVDLWTDSNDWAAVADPRLYPTIGIGFRYGRAPEIFSVASPTAGLMFTNDTMPVKARFFFAAGPMDWRGVYKANVA